MIGYATSDDGLHFKKGGPITWTNSFADMDYGGQSGPAVVPNPYGEGYLMAYTALGKEYGPTGFFGRWSTGLARSSDGITWSRIGDQPIFEGKHCKPLYLPSTTLLPPEVIT